MVNNASVGQPWAELVLQILFLSRWKRLNRNPILRTLMIRESVFLDFEV